MPLSDAQVAILYDKLTDGQLIPRSDEQVLQILNQTGADVIFLGFERWLPVPDSPDAIHPAILQYWESVTGQTESEVRDAITNGGYYYERLGNVIAGIRQERPGTLMVGGVHAQRVNQIEQDDETGRVYYTDSTREMALNRSRAQIPTLPAQYANLQQMLQERFCLQDAYFPDITKPTFQSLLLSWAERQIDEGADAIWIDALFSQAFVFQELSDSSHDYGADVEAAFSAASEIVDEIHDYAWQTYGKHVDVGTWWNFLDLPYSPPALPAVDFVTASPTASEVSAEALSEQRWTELLNTVRTGLGDVPVMAFIDWGGSPSQMNIFSQRLSPTDQAAFLATMDDFLKRHGVLFAYPVHGGFMGAKAARLAFGKLHYYDAAARQFRTYGTIVRLAHDLYPWTGTETLVDDPGHYEGWFASFCPDYGTPLDFVPAPGWRVNSCTTGPMGSHGGCANCIMVRIDVSYP